MTSCCPSVKWRTKKHRRLSKGLVRGLMLLLGLGKVIVILAKVLHGHVVCNNHCSAVKEISSHQRLVCVGLQYDLWYLAQKYGA